MPFLPEETLKPCLRVPPHHNGRDAMTSRKTAMNDAEKDAELPTFGLGLTWEDYAVGERFKSLARTITEADIVNFIGVTGMVETLFTDLTFAKGVAKAGRVAPAALTYTIIEGILCQTVIQGTGLALLEVAKKIHAPVVIVVGAALLAAGLVGAG